MSNENGIESGYRGFGRLCLSLIPWALGIAAITWLSVWVGVHEYWKATEQESRAASYVGASTRPKAAIEIEVQSYDCSAISRAEVDGSTLLMYATNNCHRNLTYFSWHWEAISPDGTTIADGYTNQCPIPRRPKDKSECTLQISTDDRIKKILVRTQTEP